MNVLPNRAKTEEPASTTMEDMSADVDVASLDTTATDVSED